MERAISIRQAVEKSSSGLFLRVKEIRELDDIQQQIKRDLERLNKAILRSRAHHPDDLVWVLGGLDHPKEASIASVESLEQQQRSERRWTRVLEMAQSMNEDVQKAVNLHLRSLGYHRQSEVEAAIAHLNDRLRAISNASTLLLLSLRQIIDGSAQVA